MIILNERYYVALSVLLKNRKNTFNLLKPLLYNDILIIYFYKYLINVECKTQLQIVYRVFFRPYDQTFIIQR